jgi:hypothetical protein
MAITSAANQTSPRATRPATTHRIQTHMTSRLPKETYDVSLTA